MNSGRLRCSSLRSALRQPKGDGLRGCPNHSSLPLLTFHHHFLLVILIRISSSFLFFSSLLLSLSRFLLPLPSGFPYTRVSVSVCVCVCVCVCRGAYGGDQWRPWLRVGGANNLIASSDGDDRWWRHVIADFFSPLNSFSLDDLRVDLILLSFFIDSDFFFVIIVDLFLVIRWLGLVFL